MTTVFYFSSNFFNSATTYGSKHYNTNFWDAYWNHNYQLAVFFWLYHDAKGKRETVLEISKNLDDPSKIEELLQILRKEKGANRL